jgi:hypothetical protein
MLARSQDMFYQSADEIRERSRRQALLYVALAAGAFVSSALQYYGQSQVRTCLHCIRTCGLIVCMQLRARVGGGAPVSDAAQRHV